MHKSLTIAFVLLLGTVILVSSSCNKDNDTDVREFVMSVDSVSHADTIVLGELFEIKFFGVIGPNDCYKFSKFEPSFGLDNMEFKLYAKENKRDDCGGAGQYMNGGGVTITDVTAGAWTITVLQPEGVAPLESSFYVKE